MLELYQSFQATNQQECLIKLINHKYVLKIIQYQLKNICSSQIETEEVKNTLFMYLVTRKKRLKFEYEYQIKSYLSLVIKGIVLNSYKKPDKNTYSYLPLETQDDYDLSDLPTEKGANYNLNELPRAVRDFMNQNLLFKAYIYDNKTLTELSKECGMSTSALSIKFKELREELRAYYSAHLYLK